MRYRLLNEPGEAESICLDVLIDPENQQALVLLLLRNTDRLGKGYAIGATRAQSIGAHQRPLRKTYYTGITSERRAKAQLNQGVPGARFDAYEWLCEAMSWYEKAEALRPPGNDDAILRWNACARIIMRNNLVPRQREEFEPALE